MHACSIAGRRAVKLDAVGSAGEGQVVRRDHTRAVTRRGQPRGHCQVGIDRALAEQGAATDADCAEGIAIGTIGIDRGASLDIKG